jgi:lysophospholipase L1-like esterase
MRLTGGLLLGGVIGSAVLLVGEAVWTRSKDFLPPESAPPVTGSFGSGDPAIRLTVMGDSTGAGVGATTMAATVGGRLAADLAGKTHRQVRFTSLAVSGARAADLATQVDRAFDGARPDVVVIVIGANDATHLTRLSRVREGLGSAVRRLGDAGVRVVVGSCPDMGAAPALPRPLRDLAGWRGRAVARAEAEAVRDAGGTVVDLGRLTGPAFRADPASTFTVDEFHPSDAGYAIWADALAPAVRAAAAVAQP